MKAAILKLKSSIKGCEAKGRELVQKIAATSDMERWQAWAEKRNWGWPTRHCLLAYAFVRGVPYSALEKSTREDNRPSAERVRAWLTDAGVEVTEEAVRAWIEGETAQSQEAAE